jgi:hypothetical protein
MNKLSALFLCSFLFCQFLAADEGRFKINNFLVYLRTGSIRLNWDEWPFILDENYKLTLDGKSFSKYSWKECTAKINGNEIVLLSNDKAGLLSRKLIFADDGFKIIFQLKLPEGAGKNGRFFYNLYLSPDFFCGLENETGLTILPSDGKSRKFEPFKKIDGKIPGDQSVGNWRKLILSWNDEKTERKMEITLSSHENQATGMLRDFRKRYGRYLLSVFFSEIPQSGQIQFELKINYFR